MKFVKKVLEAIPQEPCPKIKGLKEQYQLIMTAKTAEYGSGCILVATFFNRSTKAPYCTAYCTKEKYIVKMHESGKWVSTSIQRIKLPQNDYSEISIYDTFIADKKHERVGIKFYGDKTAKNTFEAIENNCNERLFAKQSAKSQLNRLTTAEVMSALPPLPNDIEEQILDGPMRKSRYLFYCRKKSKNPLTGVAKQSYFGYCTHCKKESELYDIPQHKGEYICPYCGSEVTAMARNISRSKLVDECKYLVWGKTGTAVFARIFYVWRDYTYTPENIHTRFCEIERFYFNYGQAYKFYSEYDGFRRYGKEIIWTKANRVTEGCFYNDSYPRAQGFFTGTCAEHSHLDDYMELCTEKNKSSKPLCYLAEYVKHSGIEHLLGCGLFNLVYEKVNHYAEVSRFNWSAQRPRDILRVTQPELEKIAALQLSGKQIAVYKKLKPYGITLNKDENGTDMINFYAGLTEDSQKKLDTLGIARVIKYLKYQKRKAYQNNTSYNHVFYEWKDFLDAEAKLNYDITSEYNLYPPNLKKAHDKVTKLLREQIKLEDKKRYAAQNAEWEKQYNALKALCFTDGKLLVRPVKSREELIHEGEVLEHCVAGYADRVRTMRTHILLIRRVEAPNEPYYTLNISTEGNVIQCHGYKNDVDQPNHSRPQFIRDFEQLFLTKQVPKWLKAKKAQEKKERAKKPELTQRIQIAV
ncbi:MAG: PcfJ domain-containing protein [Hydrogenoanaerobacterium sp.]